MHVYGHEKSHIISEMRGESQYLILSLGGSEQMVLYLPGILG